MIGCPSICDYLYPGGDKLIDTLQQFDDGGPHTREGQKCCAEPVEAVRFFVFAVDLLPRHFTHQALIAIRQNTQATSPANAPNTANNHDVLKFIPLPDVIANRTTNPPSAPEIVADHHLTKSNFFNRKKVGTPTADVPMKPNIYDITNVRTIEMASRSPVIG